MLDLGSGGGIDVILSAKRVGATGAVYGLDMTDEMLALARGTPPRPARRTRTSSKESSRRSPCRPIVDVVISNCVINLSVDKSAVLTEIARVLSPVGESGQRRRGREPSVTLRARRARELRRLHRRRAVERRVRGRLEAAGFEDLVESTHEVAKGCTARSSRP